MEAWFTAYGSFWGSIIGGAFTFLGVYLTLNFQKKQDYPKRLLALTELYSSIEQYQHTLNDFLYSLKQAVNLNLPHYSKYLPDLALNDLHSKLVALSLSVDTVTYRIVKDSFNDYFKSGYIFEYGYHAEPGHTELVYDQSSDGKNLYIAESLQIKLPVFKEKISQRISFYENKLRN